LKRGLTNQNRRWTEIKTSGGSVLSQIFSPWSRHVLVQGRRAAQEGQLSGPENPAAGHGRVEAALQAALHGESEQIFRRELCF